MNELYFLGMDITAEVKELMRLMEIVGVDGMSESELKAYRLGVDHVMTALKSTLDNSDTAIIHIDDMEIPTELSVDEVAAYYDMMP
jgi:hypothetical protein